MRFNLQINSLISEFSNILTLKCTVIIPVSNTVRSVTSAGCSGQPGLQPAQLITTKLSAAGCDWAVGGWAAAGLLLGC